MASASGDAMRALDSALNWPSGQTVGECASQFPVGDDSRAGRPVESSDGTRRRARLVCIVGLCVAPVAYSVSNARRRLAGERGDEGELESLSLHRYGERCALCRTCASSEDVGWLMAMGWAWPFSSSASDAADGGGDRIDESALDPSMMTLRRRQASYVYTQTCIDPADSPETEHAYTQRFSKSLLDHGGSIRRRSKMHRALLAADLHKSGVTRRGGVRVGLWVQGSGRCAAKARQGDTYNVFSPE